MLLSICCAHERRSASLSWFRWVGRNRALQSTDLILVDPGAKVNIAYYRNMFLSQQLLPMMLTCWPSSSSFNRAALLHTGTQHCTTSRPSNTCFIPPDLWPPNSPTSIQYYKIWSVVQQRVYQSWVYNIDELKQRLVHIWHGIDQTIIDNALDEWCGRLRDCVRANGGHFEQML